MADSSVEIHTELLDKITENFDVDGIFIKAGILEGATGSEFGASRKNQNATELKPAEYGYKHEFGVGVPQRAFLRPTLNENKDLWVEVFKRRLLSNQYDIRDALELVEQDVAPAIIQKIDEIQEPKLSPYTIAQKRAMGVPDPEKPLIATGTMRTSIGSEIVEK